VRKNDDCGVNHYAESEGMNCAPKGKPNPVVKPGKFIITTVALDHGQSKQNY